ncbi:SVM family protein [Columbia Basin potato purple top phytoplasma]|uniref:SVM family protein n=1 Tax=Columbia Basin potato purple top phytoplasma TaxID=307134 RepID=A0ABT5L9A0_9MOLU|nr:SVM family protein [Columbia Basin potato purple top phytoplasma]MDC9032170.1 SVM family protein [Columbia Basin potato purple top phytoplasma]
MFKFKNNLLLLNVFLFIGLRLFLITNNNSVMAMENNNPLKIIYNIKSKNINEKRKPIKISYYVNDKNLSLEDMVKKIDIINSNKKPISRL